MVLHKNNIHPPALFAGFTLVEAVVAIGLVGVGITSAVAALTKFNGFANSSRNSTGAYAAVMSQIDAIQATSPFNPAAGDIPKVLALGTHPDEAITIYQDPNNGVVVPGIQTTTVADASNGGATMYRANVTVSWQHLGRGPVWNPTRNRWEHQLTMQTVRAPD